MLPSWLSSSRACALVGLILLRFDSRIYGGFFAVELAIGDECEDGWRHMTNHELIYLCEGRKMELK